MSRETSNKNQMKLLGYRQFVDRIGSIYFSQIKYFYNTRSRKNREKDREREEVEKVAIISFHLLSFGTLCRLVRNPIKKTKH